jgi:hypothetical protein
MTSEIAAASFQKFLSGSRKSEGDCQSSLEAMIMKRLVLLASLACVLAFPSHAAVDCNANPSHPQCSSDGGGGSAGPYRFAGFSSGTIDGGQGMLAMHGLCQIDFGAEARMCIDEEFWLSPNAEAPSTSDAWLHTPRVVETFTGIDTNKNCKGWTGPTGYYATIVDPGGKAALTSCSGKFLPVTCCTPLQ